MENPNRDYTPEEIDEILMSQADDVNLWEERMGRDDWDVDTPNEMAAVMRREFEEPGYFWNPARNANILFPYLYSTSSKFS